MSRISRRYRARLIAPIMAVLLAAPLAAPAQNLAGPYLAARQADLSGDYREVVEYGTRALARDPDNSGLMEGLVVAHVGLGQIDQVVPVARRLHDMHPDNQVAGLVLMTRAMRDQDWDRVVALQQGGLSIGQLMDDVVAAWAEFGQGHMSQALDTFQSLADAPDGGSFATYHQALAMALAGDYEGAAQLFAGASGSLNLDRTGVIIYAQILSQLERDSDAVALIDRAFPKGGDNEIAALRGQLAAGAPVAFTAIGSPRDGLSEMFFSVAQSLARDLDPGVVLLYSRAAQYLRPDNYEAVMLSATLLELAERYELAVEAYGQVPEGDRLYRRAMKSKAEALRRWGRSDQAVEVLNALAAEFPQARDVHVALGDTLRMQDRFDEARQAYDAAVALLDQPKTDDWVLFFSRGICHERLGMWPKAEADFRQALALKPEQPSVLNYLGYSFVEKQSNLDEALDMIERAVAARPDDGFITDSLGWVYYRLGRYPEAVVQMERAVELKPVDPIVNDHLGDTYWAVGRRREAEFQWSRALSFITDDTDLSEVDPDRIRRKLEVGLDRVLEEEGAPPLKRSDEGG